jgi:hypothetical protein
LDIDLDTVGGGLLMVSMMRMIQSTVGKSW